MLLLIPALAALGIALLRGGSVRHLAELPVRGGAFIMASFGIQLLLYVSPLRSAPLVMQWSGAIYVGALLLGVAGALRNWHLGMAVRVATLGVALNASVIILNGGHMPVNAAAMRAAQGPAKVRDIAAARHYNNTRLANRSSRLVLFSDVIPVRMPGGHGNVYSLGDLLLSAGVATLIYQTSRPKAVGSRPNLSAAA